MALRVSGDFSLDDLTFDHVDVAEPGPNEVLVAVRAVSLNYRDLLVATGRYDPALSRPRVLASDGACEILAVGSAVTEWTVGDRVLPNFFLDWDDGPPSHHGGSTALGGAVDGMLTTHRLLPQHSLVRIPDALSYAEAATLPCAAVTAWNALVSIADIGPADTVLLQGTGGVSVFGLQIAKLRGARTILTSSSDEKLARAKSMGADETINYRATPDWGGKARELTAKQGVTHVLEVGGPGTLPQSLRAAAIGAQISIIGVLTGAQQPFDVRAVLGKSLRLQGIYVGSRRMLREVADTFASAAIRPVVDRVFPFEASREALRYLKSGRHFGKVVVELP